MALVRMRLGKFDPLLLAVGASAAAFAVAAIAAEPVDKLEDVQIGEYGAVMRVALICRGRCDVVPDEGVNFRINGVVAALNVDLSDRSALARGLSIEPEEGVSLVRLDTASVVNEARVITCRSDTGEAACIEYRFEETARTAAAPVKKEKSAAAPVARAKAAAKETPAPQDQAPQSDGAARDIPFIGSITLAPGGRLRDEPATGVIYLPEFSPPERFSPPSAQSPSTEPAAQDRRSENAAPPSKIVGASFFNVKSETAEILGKTLSVGACEGAKARLMGDAWALDAMIDLAFCKAADGKLNEADADFARLLDYTPDNYEALVGRGIVAMAQGDRRKGLAFYQDALNALPPIAESDRIVEAMDRN